MNPSCPTMSQAEAKQFTKDFSQLNARLIGKLTIAKTMEEAKEALSMLENLANFDLPQAKTLYGMMFLMNGKPWYDITKALYWLKKGAEEAGCASLSVRERLKVLPAGSVTVSSRVSPLSLS